MFLPWPALPPTLPLTPSITHTWDHRFSIQQAVGEDGI